MITPISEAGKAIIRMYTDNEANIPAELRPFTNSPGELMTRGTQAEQGEHISPMLKRFIRE